MNKRKLNLKKYGISGKRYKELCGFCEQYPEWKIKLHDMESNIRGIEYSDMPIYHSNADTTMNLAMKRQQLSEKCDLIEKTAKQASEDYADFLIKSVCYEVPITYLITVEGMSCSQSSFYDIRRYFFYLLDQNKKM